MGFLEDVGRLDLYAYLSAEAFYKDEAESLTLYEMLDGILTSLGLRMEQRGGSFVVYDRHGLLLSEPIDAEVRSADGVFTADESYNAINLAIEPRTELSSVSFTHPTVSEGDMLLYPRYDRPEHTAYGVRYKAIDGCPGAYHITTTPKTLGDAENFIALCFMPVEKKGAVINTAESNYRIGEMSVSNVKYNDGSWISFGVYRHEGGLSMYVDLNFAPDSKRAQNCYYLSPLCFGYERWLAVNKLSPAYNLCTPHLYKRRPLLSLNLSYNYRGLPLVLSAKLFMSFKASLYQELEEFFMGWDVYDYAYLDADVAGVIKSRLYGNPLAGLRAVGVYAEMRIVGESGEAYVLTYDIVPVKEVYKGVTVYSQPSYRHRLKWVDEATYRGKAHFLLPFGWKEFKQDTWVNIEDEYLDLGHSTEQIKNEWHEDFHKYEPIHKGGLNIPPPPISGEIKLQIYGTLSLGEALRHARNFYRYSSEHDNVDPSGYRIDAGLDLNDNSWPEAISPSNWKAFEYLTRNNNVGSEADHYRTSRLAYIMSNNVMFPSYVLMKDIKLSVVDAEPKPSTEETVKRTALLDAEAYEVLAIEPLISSDELLPSNSPSLMTTEAGNRLLGLHRSMWPGSYTGDHNHNVDGVGYWTFATGGGAFKDTNEVLVSEAFAHHGVRRHSIEGTFKTVEELRPIRYVDKLYMPTETEEHVRSGRTEYRLSEIAKISFKPSLTLGETNEEDNPKYVIK